MWNDVRVTRRGGTEQAVTDATSITNHTQRTLARTTEHANDNEALNTAEWLLAANKDVLVRVDGLSVTPQQDPTDLFPIILGAKFDTAWTVKIDPPGAGTNLDQDVVVQGIRHDITPSFWQSTFSTRRLASVETASYWILGTSLLDTGTRLA